MFSLSFWFSKKQGLKLEKCNFNKLEGSEKMNIIF
jgi:hypothetical protein